MTAYKLPTARTTMVEFSDGTLVFETHSMHRQIISDVTERMTVAGPEIVGVRLTAAAYAHGFALALPKRLQWRARQVLGAR